MWQGWLRLCPHPQTTVRALWPIALALPFSTPEWLSTPVIICALAAAALLLFSLLLKGLIKVVSLLAVLALVLCICWFLKDAWQNKEKFLSPALATQLDSIADRTLRSPQAQSAWEAVKEQFSRLTAPAIAGAEEARKKAIETELGHRAASLRKEGHRTAADELLKLRDQLRR